MKSLFKTVFLIIFFTTITRVIGFIFRIWLSRTIGTEALGLYQISFSVFSVLFALVVSGLPLIVSRMTASLIIKKDKKTEHSILTASVIISFVLSIIACLSIIVLQYPLKSIFADPRCLNILLWLLPALVFSAVYTAIRGNLWGHSNYLGVCGAELFEQIIRIIVCILLLSGILPLINGATAAAISLSVACFCSLIFVLIIYFKNGGRFRKPLMYKKLIKTSTPLKLIRVASSLIQPLIALILPLRLISAGYTQNQALSIFGIATGMTLPLLFIPSTFISALSMALIPDLAKQKTQQNDEYIKERINSSIIFSTFISCLFIPLYIGVGENLGLFFYDNLQSGALLSYSAFCMLPMCLTNITASILDAVGLEIKSCKNYILGGIFMLLIIIFMPKFIGIKALVWAIGICFSLSSILNLIMIKRKITFEAKYIKKMIYMILFCLPTMAITSFVSSLFNFVLPLFFNIAFSFAIGAVFYTLLCIIFNIFSLSSVMIFIKEKIKFKQKKKAKN